MFPDAYVTSSRGTKPLFRCSRYPAVACPADHPTASRTVCPREPGGARTRAGPAAQLCPVPPGHPRGARPPAAAPTAPAPMGILAAAHPPPPRPPHLPVLPAATRDLSLWQRMKIKLITLLLPALSKGTFQGVSVIKGPLTSAPTLGAVVPPERELPCLLNGLRFISVVL